MSLPIFQDPRFDALRNAIYHTSRGKFLDALNRTFNFVVIMLGAAAVGKIAGILEIGDYWVQFAIVLVATVQLVFDFGGRAGTHKFLQKRYYELLAEMEVAPRLDTDNAKKKWSARLLTVAGDEPIPMRALDALAYNTALDALINDPSELNKCRLRVPLVHRCLKQFIAFQGTQFLPRNERNSIIWRIWTWAVSKIRGKDVQKERPEEAS